VAVGLAAVRFWTDDGTEWNEVMGQASLLCFE